MSHEIRMTVTNVILNAGRSEVIAQDQGGQFYSIGPIAGPAPEIGAMLLIPEDWRSDERLIGVMKIVQLNDEAPKQEVSIGQPQALASIEVSGGGGRKSPKRARRPRG